MKKILLCLGLNGMSFALLYFIANKASIVVFMLVLYVSPIVINQTLVKNEGETEDKYRIVKEILMFSMIATIGYMSFAYFFEQAPYFAEFVSNNAREVSEVMSIEITDKFFALNQIVGMFFVNGAMLVLLNFKKLRTLQTQSL